MRIFYIVLKILISVIENILLVSKNHIFYSHRKKRGGGYFTGNKNKKSFLHQGENKKKKKKRWRILQDDKMTQASTRNACKSRKIASRRLAYRATRSTNVTINQILFK